MKKIILLLLAIFMLASPIKSYSWGRKGHEIVAEVAFHYLSDSTKSEVMHYLGKTSIEDAANWMDEMRSNDYYNYMRTWHYVNIEKGESYTPSVTDRNILIILNSAIAELRNYRTMKDKDVKERLYYIFHLIGDLHQPLHVGYGIDKGGNTINISFMFKNRGSNLHRAWDTDIIEQKNIQLDSVLQVEKKYTSEELKDFKQIKIMEWTNESRSLLDSIYEFKDNFLDPAYVEKNTPIIESQLFLAGIRLTAILEKIFSQPIQ